MKCYAHFRFAHYLQKLFIQNHNILLAVSFSLSILHAMELSFSCKRNNLQNIYVEYGRLPILDNISSHKTARTQMNLTIWPMKAKWQMVNVNLFNKAVNIVNYNTKPNIDSIDLFKEFFPTNDNE